MPRPDVGQHSIDIAHNTDEPGLRRNREIAEARDQEAREEARRRTSQLEWLRQYLRRKQK